MTYDPNIDTIGSILAWFGTARPEITHEAFQVQLGVHFEEISEMCLEIKGADPRTAEMIDSLREQAHLLAERLKTAGNDVRVKLEPENRIGFLDALCDQIVTATGSGYFARMMVSDGIKEVDQSNWSKFVDGQAIFDENGKIMKGPDYFKPDLTPFV